MQNGAFISGFSQLIFHVFMPYPDAPVQLHIGTDGLSEADSCYVPVTIIQESEAMARAYIGVRQLS